MAFLCAKGSRLRVPTLVGAARIVALALMVAVGPAVWGMRLHGWHLIRHGVISVIRVVSIAVSGWTGLPAPLPSTA